MNADTLIKLYGLTSECRAFPERTPPEPLLSASADCVDRLHNLLPATDRQEVLDALPWHALHAAASAELSARLAAAQAPSRLRRVLTLTNVAWFLGSLLIVAALVALFGIYLAALLALVPLVAYEALAHATSVTLLYRALLGSGSGAPAAPHMALLGLLMVTACMAGSIFRHLPGRVWDSRRGRTAFCAANLVLYATAAARLQSNMLGTLSVWWGVTALGFSIAAIPGLTIIGFDDGVAQPFGACLLAILAFLPFKAWPHSFPLPRALAPFQPGVWLWCPLVANVANLILAFRTNGAAKYLARQVGAVAVIAGTLSIGVGADVEACRAVGSVFAFLYVATKLGELDLKRAGLAWATLAFGAVLWAFGYCVSTWPYAFGLKDSHE